MVPRVRIYTTRHCSDCRRAKRFLDEKGVPFEEVNIEEVPEAAEFVLAANRGRRCVPTFEMDGRFFYLSPFDVTRLEAELAAGSAPVQADGHSGHPPQA